MLGMLLVNYLGGFAVCPRILKHTHDYCSYADTIMPQFLFAAGFAMRLSLGKRLEAGGKMPWGRAIRRILGLALVAIVWYSLADIGGVIKSFKSMPLDAFLVLFFKRQVFATLMHIAVTSLWILPVITASGKIRIWYAIVSGLSHVFVSWWFNFNWVYADPKGIDGGPLGFLTWAVPALCGTLACDAVRSSGVLAASKIAWYGVGMMLFGWLISFGTVLYNVSADQVIVDPSPATEKSKSKPTHYAPDPVIPTWERLRSWDGTIAELPFVPPPDSEHREWNYWMMSQRGGTLSYPTFAAGVSLVVYAICLWLCDGMNLRLGILRTLGTNSLAAYILHTYAGRILSATHLFPRSSSTAIQAMAGFACLTLMVYGVCRLFEWRGWYIRV
jgi:predicted acyltransferase